MTRSTETETEAFRAELARGGGILRLSFGDEGTPGGRAELLSDGLVAVAAADIAPLLAEVSGFAEGTEIATERGAVRVENLRPGDRVATRGDGLLPVREIRLRRLGWRELGLLPMLQPLRLARGACGPDCPSRDLVAAPGLRVLATDAGGGETFVTLARHPGRGGGAEPQAASVCYVQLVLDRPAAVLANGVWAEGFDGPAGPEPACRDEERAGTAA